MTGEEAKEAFLKGKPVMYDGAEYILNAIIYKRILGAVTVCARLVHIGRVSNSVIECRASDLTAKGD